MRDSNSPPDELRRANRIGLRTLGQRPQVLGHTGEGEQIFEIHAVRLLLVGTSSHFRRLVECAECRREVAGPAVQSRRDLELPAPPTICGHCSGRVTAWRAPAAPRPEPTAQPVEPNKDTVDSGNEPVKPAPAEPAQVPDLSKWGPEYEVVLEAARAEMDQRSTDAEAAFTSFFESTVARLAALEDQVRLDVAALAAVVDSQTSQTAALAVSVDSNRAALRPVVESQQELARSEKEADRRLADLEAGYAVTERDTIRTELAEALRAMSSSSEATATRTQHEVDQLRETLSQGLAEIRREVALREHQVNVAVSDLRAMVAALRSDLETSAHGQLDRLATQDERHAALSASVETLTTAVPGGERRAQILEQRVEDALERLSERLDDQRKEVAEAMERATHGAVKAAPTGGTPGTGSLLDALDDQLRAAEDRLAKRATDGPA